MGYSYSVRESEFFISEENTAKVLKAGRSLPKGLRWVNDYHKTAKSLEELFDLFGYELDYDDDLNVVGIEWLCEKIGDEDKLFKAIAPFVKEGSFLHCVGEDGEHWKWTFDGKTCKEVYGAIDWEDDE